MEDKHFLELFIHVLVFHCTLVIHIFYPLNLNLLFLILIEVFRIFIRNMFWFQQIKLLTMLKLFDDCITVKSRLSQRRKSETTGLFEDDGQSRLFSLISIAIKLSII